MRLYVTFYDVIDWNCQVFSCKKSYVVGEFLTERRACEKALSPLTLALVILFIKTNGLYLDRGPADADHQHPLSDRLIV